MIRNFYNDSKLCAPTVRRGQVHGASVSLRAPPGAVRPTVCVGRGAPRRRARRRGTRHHHGGGRRWLARNNTFIHSFLPSFLPSFIHSFLRSFIQTIQSLIRARHRHVDAYAHRFKNHRLMTVDTPPRVTTRKQRARVFGLIMMVGRSVTVTTPPPSP